MGCRGRLLLLIIWEFTFLSSQHQIALQNHRVGQIQANSNPTEANQVFICKYVSQKPTEKVNLFRNIHAPCFENSKDTEKKTKKG